MSYVSVPVSGRSLTRQLEFPLLLTTIAVDQAKDPVLRQVHDFTEFVLILAFVDNIKRICLAFMVVVE